MTLGVVFKFNFSKLNRFTHTVISGNHTRILNPDFRYSNYVGDQSVYVNMTFLSLFCIAI